MSFIKPNVAIVDYQISNLFSVKNACTKTGMIGSITCDSEAIRKADALILPGVGAFADAVVNLKSAGLFHAIIDTVKKGKPLMGICLGFQLLFNYSDEFCKTDGLSLIPGYVTRFSQDETSKRPKVPYIGWNRLEIQKDDIAFANLKQGVFMYFVHSFYGIPVNKVDILSITSYCGLEYCSAVSHSNIFGFQFHPEKSGPEGLKIYNNFRKFILKEG